MDTNFYDFWTPTFQRLRGQQTKLIQEFGTVWVTPLCIETVKGTNFDRDIFLEWNSKW